MAAGLRSPRRGPSPDRCGGRHGRARSLRRHADRGRQDLPAELGGAGDRRGRNRIGENRVQEAVAKRRRAPAIWHLIGPCSATRRRRPRDLRRHPHRGPGRDRERLQLLLERTAGRRQRVPWRSRRRGAAEAACCRDAPALATAILAHDRLELLGLMRSAFGDDPEASRPTSAPCASCATGSPTASAARCAAVDGHEPRLRGGGCRGRHHGPRRYAIFGERARVKIWGLVPHPLPRPRPLPAGVLPVPFRARSRFRARFRVGLHARLRARLRLRFVHIARVGHRHGHGYETGRAALPHPRL